LAHQVRAALEEQVSQAADGLGIGREDPVGRRAIEALARRWAQPYWAGARWCQVNLHPEGDFLRQLAFAAGLRLRCPACRQRWRRFERLSVQEVLRGAPKPGARLCRLEPFRVRKFLRHLRRQLLRCDRATGPQREWLGEVYGATFLAMERVVPAAPPRWWDEILGGPPVAPPPYPAPRIPAARLPGKVDCRLFVEEESRPVRAVRRILSRLRALHTPLEGGRPNGPISYLQFLYLRYRNWPDMEDEGPPSSAALGQSLSTTTENIDTIRHRIHVYLVGQLQNAVEDGRIVPVGERWQDEVLPRPGMYHPGRLLPRFRRGPRVRGRN